MYVETSRLCGLRIDLTTRSCLLYHMPLRWRGELTELRFNARGDGFVTGSEGQKASVPELLGEEVLEANSGQGLVVLRGVATPPLPLTVPKPGWLDPNAGVSGQVVSLKAWVLPWMTKGVGVWWSAGDWAHAFHPGLAPNAVGRYLLNNWAKWEGYCKGLVPVALGLRKAIDRSGRERHWSRFLPEHTWSTTGLLAVLLGQATKSKIPDPEDVQHFMSRLLAKRLEGEAVELRVPLDPQYAQAFCFPGGRRHRSSARAFLCKGTGSTHARWSPKLRASCASASQPSWRGSREQASLLRERWTWLLCWWP